MPKLRERTPLWWILLIAGLIGTALLVAQRMDVQSMPNASAALSQTDLSLLAQASGLPEGEWLYRVSPSGLGYLALGERFVNLAGQEGLTFVLEDSGDTPVITEDYTSALMRLVLPAAYFETPVIIEDHTRTTMYLPQGMEEQTGPVMKALWLFPDYADRAVGTDTREIENLLFRAATDRSIRLFILSPFYNEKGELLSDPMLYAQCLSSLGERLDRRGISLGGTASPMGLLPASQSWERALAGMLPAAAGVWLIFALPPVKKLPQKRRKGLEYALVILAALAVVALALVLPGLGEKLLPLAAAVLLPCVGMLSVWQWAKGEPEALSRRPLALSAGAAFGLLMGWSLLCGLSVSALMTTPDFLMGAAVFSGVKFALGLPLALCFCLLASLLWRELLRAGKRLWVWLTLLALAGMALLLVLRSGDLPGGVSGLETAFRNLLEDWFYGRPRTKELLFAAPCLPVFVWACRKKLPPLQLLCGMGVGLECVSVTNTFCHGVASVSFSAIRSLEGGLAGWCLGMLAAGALALLFRKKTA